MGTQRAQVMDLIIQSEKCKCSALVCCLDGTCSIHSEVKLTSRASGGLSTGTEEVLVLEDDYVGLWSRKA